MPSALLDMGLCQDNPGESHIPALPYVHQPYDAAAIMGRRMKNEVQL